MRGSQIRRIAAAALLALVGLSGTTAAGFWQYDRAHRDDIAAQVLAAPTIAVQQLVTPGAYVPEHTFAHRVTVRGTLDNAQALATCARTGRAGAQGCWLLAPVTLADSPEAITVLLGWLPTARVDASLATLRADGSKDVDVTGRLQPAEVVDKGHAILRPTDRVSSINVNDLALRWDRNLLDGYVVLDAPQIGERIVSPLLLPPSGITWRNLIYAWQWWAFAAFVVFLLIRYIIDVRSERPTLSPDDTSTDSPREESP